VTFKKGKPVIKDGSKKDEGESTPEVKRLIAVMEGEMTRKEL
jgi:hypothetical protein